MILTMIIAHYHAVQVISGVESAIYQLIGFILDSRGYHHKLLHFLSWNCCDLINLIAINIILMSISSLFSSFQMNNSIFEMIIYSWIFLMNFAQIIVPSVLVFYSKSLKYKLHCLSALSLVFCTLTTKIVYQ